MRRLIVMALGAALVLTPMSGCKRRRKAPVESAKETPTEPATMLGTADPRSSLQLTKGFYEIENGWRWTGKEFSASLRPPSTAPTKGAVLLLQFSLIEPSIDKLGPMTLTAKVGSTACPAHRYTKAGKYEFKCEVPASEFAESKLALADFALDKVLPMTETDQRELGVVVAMVGFEAK